MSTCTFTFCLTFASTLSGTKGIYDMGGLWFSPNGRLDESVASSATFSCTDKAAAGHGWNKMNFFSAAPHLPGVSVTSGRPFTRQSLSVQRSFSLCGVWDGKREQSFVVPCCSKVSSPETVPVHHRGLLTALLLKCPQKTCQRGGKTVRRVFSVSLSC